jgi:hypothetical protein
MNIKIATTFSLLLTSILYAGIKNDSPKEAFSTLKINQEIHISDTAGVLIPNSIITLIPSNNIKFYLVDGTVLTGLVKEITMIDGELFKVFGEITNKDNSGFGFVLAKEGIFAGAVVYRNTEETLTVEFSQQAKGYVLVKSLGKKPKPI